MISILLATTGRPEMAVDCLSSILDTTEGRLVEYVVAIDNDFITQERVETLFKERKVSRLKVSYQEDYRGPSKAWNDALRLSAGDPVVLAADDLIFHPGWLEAAQEKMAELPEGGGLVGFNDTQIDGQGLATHYMLSRWFIDHYLGGVIAWEFYKHSFNDVEINERAKLANRFIYAPKAIVEHRHWIFGTRSQDATDTRFLGEHAESQAKYTERAAQGFPDT